MKKLEEDRFHLVVVGEFNHGKTTFVNALLGEHALAVGVTPTTAAIHHIKYAETPEATVVYTSGKRESIPFERGASASRSAAGASSRRTTSTFWRSATPRRCSRSASSSSTRQA